MTHRSARSIAAACAISDEISGRHRDGKMALWVVEDCSTAGPELCGEGGVSSLILFILLASYAMARSRVWKLGRR